MKSKTLLVGLVALVVIIATALFTTKSSNNSKVVNNNGVYCLPDGTFTKTMPIQSHRSYCIKSDSVGKTYSANTPSEYSFSIVDDQGNILKNFEITHTKLMHIIVVRKDLKHFQHVHPEYNQGTGIFTLTNLMFPADGEYRIFADFTTDGGQKDSMVRPFGITIFQDVVVGSNYASEALGTEETTKTFNGYQVTLATHGSLTSGVENMFMLHLSQRGKPIADLEPYLGALGHSIILQEGTLDFIHAHPMEGAAVRQNGMVNFMITFPEAGKYKVFTQFQKGGKVTTTDFVVSVTEGASSGMEVSMPGIDHSMH